MERKRERYIQFAGDYSHYHGRYRWQAADEDRNPYEVMEDALEEYLERHRYGAA